MPFDAIGAGVPLSSLLAAKVRWVVEFSAGASLQCVLSLVFRGIDAFKVAGSIVEWVAVPMMYVTAVRHRAVMMLPHRSMKVGRSWLSPLMAAVIIAR
jgi:hypothetical protein